MNHIGNEMGIPNDSIMLENALVESYDPFPPEEKVA